MGKRDYRHREPKKSKRGGKKVSLDTILPAPVTVEVLKKGRRKQETEE